jgi:monothiol glutaredoxin
VGAASGKFFAFTPAHSAARFYDTVVRKFPKTALDRRKPRPLPCAVSVHTHAHRMIIKAYLKPSCGWSNGVRAIMRKHGLAFEDIDIINNRANYAEMVAKSGQPLSPCVEIDGVMLADISGEEVENYLLSNDLVKPNDVRPDVATNAGCSDEEHAKMATKTIRFF